MSKSIQANITSLPTNTPPPPPTSNSATPAPGLSSMLPATPSTTTQAGSTTTTPPVTNSTIQNNAGSPISKAVVNPNQLQRAKMQNVPAFLNKLYK